MLRRPTWTLAGLLLGACAEPPAEPGAVAVTIAVTMGVNGAAEVPGTTVVDLQGLPVDPLTGEHVTVLLFVSTHCPISNRYAPTIGALARSWTDRGVHPWLVYPDPDDEPAAIRAHQAEFALDLPALRDPGHLLVARAGARVTPEVAVFGPGAATPAYHGRIDDRVQGFGKIRPEASVHELRDAVDAMLRGEAPRPAQGPAFGCYISDLQ